MRTAAPSSDAPPAIAPWLAGRVKRYLDGVPAAAPFLVDWPAAAVADRAVEPRALPVLAWLGAVAGSPAALPLARDVAATADRLEWRQTYTADDFGQAFLDRYGWSELVGLRGPVASTGIACGVLMLGPGTDYPAHAHEAEELYIPLAGAALWRAGDEPFVTRRPGDLVRHGAWVPHAMRTGEEALVALYLWRGGDLAAKSRIMGRE